MINLDINVKEVKDGITVEVKKNNVDATISEFGTVLDILNRLYSQKNEYKDIELCVEL